MLRTFSVWPVVLAVVGEMEMHSVATLATLQTPLVTFQKSTLRQIWIFPNLI